MRRLLSVPATFSANTAAGFHIISARLNDILAGMHDFKKFRLKDGVLHSGDIGIYPTTKEDCFFDFSFFGEVCFGRDESGAVESIDWKREDFELMGIKKDTN